MLRFNGGLEIDKVWKYMICRDWEHGNNLTNEREIRQLEKIARKHIAKSLPDELKRKGLQNITQYRRSNVWEEEK